MQKRSNLRPFTLIIGAIMLFHWPSVAQVNHYRQIDSLLQLLRHSKSDTSKAGLLTTLGQYYFPINTDSGFAYAQRALLLSKRLGWKKGEVLALKAIGSNYWAKADYLKCQDYFLQMRDVALHANDSSLLALAYHALAISHLPFGNTDKGIEYLEKALAIDQRSADPNRLMAIYHNLGDIYEGKKDYRQALFYYKRSLPAAQDANYGLGIAHTYLKIGSLNTALNNLTEGLDNLQRSLMLARSLNEQPVIVLALMDIAAIYRKQALYNRAIAYYDSALALSATFKANHYIGLHGTYLLSAADLYLEKGRMEKKSGRHHQASFDLRQAVAYLNQALLVSASVPDWVAMRDEALLLSNVYENMGNHSRALQAYKDYVVYRDSVINIEKVKKQLQHEMKVTYQDSIQYIKKLQEKQLRILAQENRLNKYKTNQVLLFAAITIIGLALAATLFHHRYRLQKIHFNSALKDEKLQKQLREAELQHKLNDMTLAALHSQMNPHFIFNALNTIQSFIYTDNKRAAAGCLGKFSELIRKTLDYSRRHAITLEEELEIIRLYIDIEKARFDDQLITEVIVADGLPLAEAMLPPLFVQPYVENALKHGLLHQQGAKKLTISVQEHEAMNAVVIKIDDNGIGRARSAAINKNRLHHYPFASEANEKRADLMKELWGHKLKVRIEDKVSAENVAEGTTVFIYIPLEKTSLANPAAQKQYG